MATNGGIIHYLKKIIEGIQYQLVNLHTTEKMEGLKYGYDNSLSKVGINIENA